MTGLKNLILGAGVAASALAAGAGQGFSHEPGDFGQYLRGVTIGIPIAAAPPEGLYFLNGTMLGVNNTGYGQDNGLKAYSYIDIPTLLWSTGWHFLGANVTMAVTQPVFMVDLYGPALPGGSSNGPPFTNANLYPTVHNTVWNPLTLSWNLGNGLFVAAGFDFYAPDGSHYDNTLNPDYWTFEPHGAISYLANGWNLTADLRYDFNTASQGTTGVFNGTPFVAFGNGYRSGDQLYVDLTATHKFGNWELGPVGYLKFQTTSDQPGSGFSCAQMAATSPFTCGNQTDVALGALVGYDFGPVDLKVFLTDSVYTKDEIGGLSVWSRLSFRLWAPEAPPSQPLITK